MLQDFVQKEVEPQALEFNQNEQFNLPLFQKLGDLGLLGLTCPTEYGGSGMDATASVLVHEELSTSDPAFGLSYLAHSLLLVHNLSRNGSEDQKNEWLPQACSGKIIGGMAMSEPHAGTDVLGMSTKAYCLDGEEDNWILNGRKFWITNGTLDGTTTGDLFVVYAKTGPSRQEVSTFLVPKDAPGFQLGQHIQGKLGMRASPTAELVLDDVSIPKSQMVGTVHGAIRGMMRNLEIERLGLAAMGLGIARRSINVMKEYAQERSAFGSTLTEFGQIQQMISTSYAEYMAGRTYVYALANRLDLYDDTNKNNRLDADATKLYCAQMAKRVADRAIQVLGGNGYLEAYQVERLWRDAKLLEIGGGTNESHHKNMARELKSMSELE